MQASGSIYGLMLSAQQAEITAHCFGDCGKAQRYVMVDSDLGELIPCVETYCPHLDMESSFEVWSASGRPVLLRKLKL